ncbi:MAG: hypothetical protein AAGG44_06355 [Planctomycetota bacterium]
MASKPERAVAGADSIMSKALDGVALQMRLRIVPETADRGWAANTRSKAKSSQQQKRFRSNESEEPDSP